MQKEQWISKMSLEVGIAIGSLSNVRNQLEKGKNCGFISEQQFNTLTVFTEISKNNIVEIYYTISR